MRVLFISLAMLALAASSLLLSQFVLYDQPFKLKTGLALFTALFIMIMAVLDGTRDPMPSEDIWRFRLVIVLAVTFACVIFAKSLMWQASVNKLRQTLRQMEGSCAEMVSNDFEWLENSPYTILNNWSLSSLALVIQDHQPRKLVLAQNDCQRFHQSGMVQIDPWSLLAKEYIVPPLD